MILFENYNRLRILDKNEDSKAYDSISNLIKKEYNNDSIIQSIEISGTNDVDVIILVGDKETNLVLLFPVSINSGNAIFYILEDDNNKIEINIK